MNEWYIVPAVLHVIFIILYIYTKKNHDVSDHVLAVWLIFIVLPLAERVIPIITGRIFVLPISFLATQLTFGPFMLLYTRLIIRSSPVKTISYGFHFIPFILFSFLYLLFPKSVGQMGPLRIESLSGLEMVYNWLVLLSLMAYSAIILYVLMRHRKVVKNYLSYSSLQITVIWLVFLSLFNFAGFLTLTLIDLSIINTPFPVHGLLPFFYIYILSYFGIRQSVVFSSVFTKEPEEVKKKYLNSGLNEESAKKFTRQLIDYMDTVKPYLDADLTIESLARKLVIPRHSLTQIINERLNKNFYNFINEYRIFEVKKRIDSKEADRFTLFGLALDCGFNSKATFNTAFKKFTRMTPSQYKKLVQP